ncbi:MAG: DNA gyrase inhibitor YacG [Gammaproteobacteria bacterium]|nr:DNA gyrase inhibitor YacG [Gammaproteobacteria bacterium]MBV9697344.1 DNA gyrase inhibitor YacG [Gammaproteobacteria bacterium]
MAPPRVKCPTCQRPLDWEHAPFRPFCSERCRLIDLGAWLSEQRAIPGDPSQAEAPPEKPHEGHQEP